MADNIPPVNAGRVAYLAALEQHIAAARQHGGVLVTRAQTLARNGVDLRHPERMGDFIDDQVKDAVQGACVPGCVCGGDQGSAALVLIAELSRQLAELTR